MTILSIKRKYDIARVPKHVNIIIFHSTITIIIIIYHIHYCTRRKLGAVKYLQLLNRCSKRWEMLKNEIILKFSNLWSCFKIPSSTSCHFSATLVYGETSQYHSLHLNILLVYSLLTSLQSKTRHQTFFKIKSLTASNGK